MSDTNDSKNSLHLDNKTACHSEDFIFIQAADTQLGLIDNWAGNPAETRIWDEEIRLTKKSIELANQMTPKPKFFVVCGDLVDDFIGDRHRERQEKDFFKLFESLDNDIPLVCVCGNHDIGNSPTKETVNKYRSSFGADYFSFWVQNSFFIVLNSQYYADHSNVPEEYEKQEKWLDEQLEISKSDGCQHCIIFQHIPLFLKTPNEEDEYFNFKKGLRTTLLDKFKRAGIKKIFCGHYHRNAGGFDEEIEVVVTSAIGCQLGDDKSGFRIVKVGEMKISHKYYSLEDCPLSVDLTKDLP